MGDRFLRTSEAALIVGVKPDVLRKWKYRGFLKLAPKDNPSPGRHNESLWSPEAVQEAVEWNKTPRINRPLHGDHNGEGE